jgi:hypothetical protein
MQQREHEAVVGLFSCFFSETEQDSKVVLDQKLEELVHNFCGLLAALTQFVQIWFHEGLKALVQVCYLARESFF